MLRYLPILAVAIIVANIVFIIYRMNHWVISTEFAYACWASLVALGVILVYYTWHKANDIAVTSMIMWTFGILFIPVLIIPWWFMRIYPKLSKQNRLRIP